MEAGFNKKKNRQRGGLSTPQKVSDQATIAAALRFLRQPNRPIAPSPLANNGSAVGSGVELKPPFGLMLGDP